MKGKIKVAFTTVGIGVLAAFCLAEVVFRFLFQIIPGQNWDGQWYHPVDSLVVWRGYEADENGIFKITSDAKHEVDHLIQKGKNFEVVSPSSKSSLFESGLANLPFQAFEIMSGHSKSSLGNLYRHIQKKKCWNGFDSLIFEFIHHPINSNGFRSIAFRPLKEKRLKIMLLGDSYTWGQAARNLANSFSDRLLADGYLVYNFGIPGADPAQYLKIAQTYMPIIKPDIVIVNLYAGNDITYFKRTPEAFQPIFYFTNAGCVLNQPLHTYLKSPEKALAFSLKMTKIPQRTLFDKCCSVSSIGTVLWKFCAKMEWINPYPLAFEDYCKEAIPKKLNKPSLIWECAQIKALSKKNNAACFVSFIPEVKPIFGISKPTDYKFLQTELQLVFDSTLTILDYDNPHQSNNRHFNESGHEKYYRFLKNEIKKLNLPLTRSLE